MAFITGCLIGLIVGVIAVATYDYLATARNYD